MRQYSAPGDGTIPLAKQKYVPTSGTYPKGFLAGSTHVGVKASNTKFDDLALVVSETPASAAAVFTRNPFRAAPTLVSSQTLLERKNQGIRAVIVNSGCANAVTGVGGAEDAKTMGKAVDKALLGWEQTESIESPSRSVVMSTGVIGQRLPIAKILSKIPTAISSLGSSHEKWLGAARAICTTDTFPKLLSREFTLPGYPGITFSIAGMTKGAGMIHPNMATLLGIICTDVPIAPQAMQPLLTSAINESFNRISIDGDTSTNDTIAFLANGAAAPGSPIIPQQKHGRGPIHEDYAAFSQVLSSLAVGLAQIVVRDGEGATKFVTVRVINARDSKVALAIAESIVRSPLVKTALYGRDANWGRILCAIGNAHGLNASLDIRMHSLAVSFVSCTSPGETLPLVVDGEPQEVDEEKAARMLEDEDLEIRVDLGFDRNGQTDVTYWTCDFSHEYVTINGDYRT